MKKNNYKYAVYIHTSPSGKKYVGITRNIPEKRWLKNGNGYKDQPFYYAIKKYGWDSFSHEVIIDNVSMEVAKAWEQALIAILKTKDRRYGYNFTDGGDTTYDKNKKPVICIETLKTYESCEEAGRQCGISGKDISQCCNDKAITAGGFHWREYDKNKGKKYYQNLKFRTRKFRDKPVICLETLQVFKSATEAGRTLNNKRSCHIISCCKGKRNVFGGYHWAYYDPTVHISKYKALLKEYIKRDTDMIDMPVVLVEKRKIYNSAREGAKDVGIKSPESITDNCRGISKSAGGYHWAFYEKDKPMSYYDTLIEKNLRKSAVQNIETGEVFESISKASKEIGVSISLISKACRIPEATAGGYHWKYVEDKLIQNWKNTKKVICLETHQIFSSVIDAKKSICGKNISKCLRNGKLTAGGYHWDYFDESRDMNYYDELLREYNIETNKPKEISKNQRELISKIKSKPIICIETNELFSSSRKASEKYNITPSTLCNCLKGKRETAGGFHWEYADCDNK